MSEITTFSPSFARRSRRIAAASSPSPRCASRSRPRSRRASARARDDWCDCLEEKLVAVGHLLRRLLEREELVGAQVALVVALAAPGQDRRVVLLGRGLGRVAARHARSILPAMGDLFSDAAGERLPRSRRSRCGCGRAPRRVRRPGADPGRGLGATARDRRGPRRLDDPLRAAGEREDDARARRREHDRRGVRGALGGVRDGHARARGDRAAPASGSADRAADDSLPRRDPPLQQGPAGCAPAGGRGGDR